ncbi:MAG: ferredoxin [Patescibacteria group bacterium]
MKVWIDQDLCTGDGICVEDARDVFVMYEDGLAYVKAIGEKTIVLAEDGLPLHRGAFENGLVEFPDSLLNDVIAAAEDCPGACIFIEP